MNNFESIMTKLNIIGPNSSNINNLMHYPLYDTIKNYIKKAELSNKKFPLRFKDNLTHGIINKVFNGFAQCKKDFSSAIQAKEGIASTLGTYSSSIVLDKNSVAISKNMASKSLSFKENCVSIVTDIFSIAHTEGTHSVSIATSSFSESSATGKNSVAIVIGERSYASGSLGSWLVLTEVEDDEIINMKAIKVDGEIIKANTKYTLCNNKVIEK